MKLVNVLIYLSLIIVAYFYFIYEHKTEDLSRQSNSVDDPKGVKDINPTKAGSSSQNYLESLAPKEVPYDELPEDIKRAAKNSESNDPNDLPDDLKAQLNAPPPELPDDLRRQLEMPPQELPPDLKAQLEAPPPPIPDDIKRALAIPPRTVSIDEVNTPLDNSDQGIDEGLIE